MKRFSKNKITWIKYYSVRDMAVCPKCKGFGNLKGQKCEVCNLTLKCDMCDGKGWVPSAKV